MFPAQPAPDLAPTFALIIRNVIALMLRAFCRHPVPVVRIVLICNHLNRAAQRLTALMSRIALGATARSRAGCQPRAGGRPAASNRLPARRAWLLHAMRDHPERHNAAAYGCQLAALLAQPGVGEFLAAHPSARRILNPVCHFLGLPTTRKPRAPRPVAPQAATAVTPRAAAPRRTPRPSPGRAAIPAGDPVHHPAPLRKKT